jgi:predicted amidohydrolase YtcJ
LASGATLALGSDWPVAHSDPRVGMAWSMLRRSPGAAGEPFEPAQRLTAAETLAGYTTGCAAVAGESGQGRLTEGARADITAFGADPLETPADDLPDLPIALTLVDGAIAYRGG